MLARTFRQPAYPPAYPPIHTHSHLPPFTTGEKGELPPIRTRPITRLHPFFTSHTHLSPSPFSLPFPPSTCKTRLRATNSYRQATTPLASMEDYENEFEDEDYMYMEDTYIQAVSAAN